MNLSKTSSFSTRAWIELDRKALAGNVRFLRSRLPQGCSLMPAVKADAYGHGAILIARELNRLGVEAFCVACIQEAVLLRENGIVGEILILGYTHPVQFPLIQKYNLIQTAVDYEYAKQLNLYARRQNKKLRVHIGVDTGMHRLGERSENIEKLSAICSLSNLSIDGIFSHLCAADGSTEREKQFTEKQISAFSHVLQKLKTHPFFKNAPPKTHLLSSYGILRYPEFAGDYARVGIALYGVLSTEKDTTLYQTSVSQHVNAHDFILTPVLSLKARVAIVKELYKGESAGYGLAFTAERDMRLAAITIGYADGLPRIAAAHGGSVLLHGRRAPIIGRICMDQTLVDISGIPGVQAGDTAVLIGRSGSESISAGHLAEQSATITNELLSRLGSRLERVWKE